MIELGNIKGQRGISIDNIAKTSTSGLIDTYTIIYDNETTSTFEVNNGADGAVTTVAGRSGNVVLTTQDIAGLDIAIASIKTPIITAPAEASTNISVTTTITSSAYDTSALVIAPMIAMDCEIATDSGFSNIIFTGSSATITIIASGLSPSTVYYARTRYKSEEFMSDWSATVSYTTQADGVNTPTLAVEGSPTDVAETPALTTSAFSSIVGTDTHASTDWEIRSSDDLTSIWASAADTVNKLSIVVPKGVLQVSTEYIFKARHNGTTLGAGGYTTITATTKDAFTVPLQAAGSHGYATVPSSDPFALIGLAEMAGTNTAGHDNYGNYIHSNGSIMCYVPKVFYRIGHADNPTYATYGENSIDTKGIDYFADEIEANAAGYALHRAFIDNGQEKSGVFIDKYKNSKHADNTQGVSVFGGNPIGLTTNADYTPSSTMTGGTGILADAVTIARARGAEYTSMAFYHYGLLAMLSVAHAQATTDIANNAWYDAGGTTNFPKGCNSSLSDINDNTVTYTTSGDTADKPLTGATANFNKTTHNGCTNGVADLNGGMYEVAIGLTSAGDTATATTAITNNTIHILKLSSKLADLTGGWDGITDAWGNTTHLNTLFDLVTSPHALGSTTGTVYWGSGANGVFPNDLNGVSRDICGFIPKDDSATDATGTNQFGTDYMYRYNRMNMAVLCCGYWSHSADAGLFARLFYYCRSADNATCSFRSLAYGS